VEIPRSSYLSASVSNCSRRRREALILGSEPQKGATRNRLTHLNVSRSRTGSETGRGVAVIMLRWWCSMLLPSSGSQTIDNAAPRHGKYREFVECQADTEEMEFPSFAARALEDSSDGGGEALQTQIAG
jgi:hypothetical protein